MAKVPLKLMRKQTATSEYATKYNLKIVRPGLGQRIYFSTSPFNQYLKRKIKCWEKNLKIVY